ncbi:MAG: ComF family protein [Clostridiaceae bacterium]
MENGFIKNIKIIYESLKETLYPSKGICFSCKEESDNNISLCNKCISKLNYVTTEREFKINDNEILKCHTVTFYSGIIKEMILNLKYKGDFEAGEALAYLMNEKLKSIKIQIDYVTFIPMLKKDEKKRGFNQSNFLAKELCKLSKLQLKKTLLKIKSTKDQIGLSKDERMENIKGCFKITNEKYIKNKSILLVDDVLTTGSTVIEGVKILKQAKCNEIIVLTVAKSTV